MMRAPLPIMFAGLSMLAMAGAAMATPRGTSPVKKDTPHAKKKPVYSVKNAAARKTAAKAPKVAKRPEHLSNFVVLQIEGDLIVPSSKTAIVKIGPNKRKA
jgi:hypothetical protein